MRWLTYFILAYLTLGIQIGAGATTRISGAGPNLVLLSAVYIAINAPRDSALLGCFVLGALQDLATMEPLGLYALSYALVGWFIVSAQDLVRKDHPLTHFSLTLAAGMIVGLVLGIHGWLYPPGEAAPGMAAIRVAPMTLFMTALYTAILAPFVLWALGGMKKAFAFRGVEWKAMQRRG